MRSIRGGWLAPLALAIVAVACGGGPAQAPQQPARPAGPVPGGVEPGRQAPDFAITTTDGEEFRLSAHRDQVVVLDFLAPGCPSCAAEVPTLGEVWTAFRDQGAVVALIDIGGVSAEEVISYYRGQLGGADHLYAVDEGFRVATLYKVLALGTTVIVDRAGIISYRDAGVTSPAVLEREVREALA